MSGKAPDCLAKLNGSLKRAEELEAEAEGDISILKLAYYCRLAAVEMGVSLLKGLSSSDTNIAGEFLSNQMGYLESLRGRLDISAATRNTDMKLLIQSAVDAFHIADASDREGNITKDTIKAYVMASSLADIHKQLTGREDLTKFGKYCKARFMELMASVREQRPRSAPPAADFTGDISAAMAAADVPPPPSPAPTPSPTPSTPTASPSMGSGAAGSYGSTFGSGEAGPGGSYGGAGSDFAGTSAPSGAGGYSAYLAPGSGMNMGMGSAGETGSAPGGYQHPGYGGVAGAAAAASGGMMGGYGAGFPMGMGMPSMGMGMGGVGGPGSMYPAGGVGGVGGAAMTPAGPSPYAPYPGMNPMTSPPTAPMPGMGMGMGMGAGVGAGGLTSGISAVAGAAVGVVAAGWNALTRAPPTPVLYATTFPDVPEIQAARRPLEEALAHFKSSEAQSAVDKMYTALDALQGEGHSTPASSRVTITAEAPPPLPRLLDTAEYVKYALAALRENDRTLACTFIRDGLRVLG